MGGRRWRPRAPREDPHEARRPRGAPQRRRLDVTRVRVGTSGWNYTEWKGSFYPDDMKPAAMLPYYAARFGTVEVNATFYRMPTPKVVAGWAAAAPASPRSEEHTSELQSHHDLVCRLLLEKKKK